MGDVSGSSKIKIKQWCHFTETLQDYPDVCLVTQGVIPACWEDDIEETITYEYYGWYKITCEETSKSVYRRIRKTAGEGYPHECIVLDPYTSEELGLGNDWIAKSKSGDGTFRIHHRSKKQNVCSKKLRDKSLTIDKHLKKCKTKPQYVITGFPIYLFPSDKCLILEKVKKNSVGALRGRTLRHPDYAIRLACDIAVISLVLAVLALLIGIASLIIGFHS